MSESLPSVDPPNVQRSWPRRFLNRLEVDRAVFFALILRGWQLLGGAVSVALLGLFFEPEVRGYYYAFANLMALQTFFELGFNIAIINLSSHEWAHVRLDERGAIVGDGDALSRLVSLGRLIFKWYAVACLLFIVGVGIGGAWFLSQRPNPSIDWQTPWWCLVVLSGLLLWMLPFNALLEGCGQVVVVNQFRVLQAVGANLAVWSVVLAGGGLWAAVAATSARLLSDLILLGGRYRVFFRVFWEPPASDQLHWQTDVWPMQWRLALGGIFSYFSFSLFVPAMWQFRGEVAAGQMGMTWQLLTAVQAGALAWVQTRVPRFGVLVSQRDFRELDRIYFRLTGISLGVLFVGGSALCSLIFALHRLPVERVWPLGDSLMSSGMLAAVIGLKFRFAACFLAPLPTALFTLAIIVYQIPHCQVFYVRAHKIEPFLWVNLVSSIAIGAAVWFLGKTWGPTGSAAGYLGCVVLIIIPIHTLIWRQCRGTHGPADRARF